MGKFQDRVDAIQGHTVAKVLIFKWILEFALDYSDRGDEATKEWFG